MGRIACLLAVFLLLFGCAAEIRSPVIELEGSIAVPWTSEEDQLQVVFPAGESATDSRGDSLTRLYGPDWKDLQDSYKEYRFNGER